MEIWIVQSNQYSYENSKTCVVETAGRRHRVDDESIKFQATTGYVLCWIDIFIISGGQFG